MGRITETYVAVLIVTMVTVNVGGETNIPVTLRHGRRKAKNYRNLALTGGHVKEGRIEPLKILVVRPSAFCKYTKVEKFVLKGLQ